MAYQTKADRLQAKHAEAISAFGAVYCATQEEREQCREDRRFYSVKDGQWEGKLGEQFENRPKLQIDFTHLAVIRIINEYRNNRISVQFESKTGDADDDLAYACDGLFRADEQDSGAQEAYDTAFEEAVGGGMGAWRLRAEYEDEYDPDNEQQRIRFEPINDADSSVYFDLGAKRQDKSDARKCWVLTPLTRDAYEAEYDDAPSDWPNARLTWQGFDWVTPDMVYVAEYYEVEDRSYTLETWANKVGDEEKHCPKDYDDDDELAAAVRDLEARGFEMISSRRVKKRAVHKYTMSGGKVLSDDGYIAGQHIPVVVCYGKRWYVDNVERFMGHVRLAKDPQRLKNMQTSALAEISATGQNRKPIFMAEQVAAHKHMWETDSVENYPYLVVDPVIDPTTGQMLPGGPVGYTETPQISPAMAALLQITDADIRQILGNQEQGDKIVSNISDDAVARVQSRLDMQTFIYMSNFAKAQRRSGEIWLSMAKDIIVEDGRKMKTVNPNGETEAITIGEPKMDPDTGVITETVDLSSASFDVAVDVGPSSDSKREATVKSLMDLMAVTVDPEMQQVIGLTITSLQRGEGMGDLRSYARRKLLAMGVAEPTDQEKKEMEDAQAEAANQPQQPDPNAELLMSEAEKSRAEAQHEYEKIAKTRAETARAEASAAKDLADIQQNERQQVIDAVERLQPAGQQGPTTQPPFSG